MFITGTIIDSVAIVLSGILGLCVKKALPQSLTTPIITGIAGVAAIVGISMALKSHNLLISLVSLTLGILVGEVLQLEDRLKKVVHVSNIFEIKANQKVSIFSSFVTSSLISLVGPLMILGSIQNGISGKPDLLLLKSGFDIIATIILASSLGVGVLLSAIPVFLAQGSISFIASILGNFLSSFVITEISAVGGIILVFLSFNVLQIKQTKIINMLPSLLFVGEVCKVFQMLKLI